MLRTCLTAAALIFAGGCLSAVGAAVVLPGVYYFEGANGNGGITSGPALFTYSDFFGNQALAQTLAAPPAAIASATAGTLSADSSTAFNDYWFAVEGPAGPAIPVHIATEGSVVLTGATGPGTSIFAYAAAGVDGLLAEACIETVGTDCQNHHDTSFNTVLSFNATPNTAYEISLSAHVGGHGGAGATAKVDPYVYLDPANSSTYSLAFSSTVVNRQLPDVPEPGTWTALIGAGCLLAAHALRRACRH